MDLSIAGRRAVVTGASRGIGRAIATELAAAGVHVALVARDPVQLAATADAISDTCRVRTLAIAADLDRPDGAARAMKAAGDGLGGLDMLVNNAGSIPAGGLGDVSDEIWQSSIDLKLMGYVRCARAVLPGLVAQGWGRIVNIVGMGAYNSSPRYLVGGAVNAALLNITRALAKEGAAHGVTVNAINPGPVATQRWTGLIEQRARLAGISIEEEERRTRAGMPMGRPGKPEEIAALAAFLCSERAAYVNGALINADGGAASGF